MDYKKKYEQALTNARQEYNTTENVERKQWLEELFPELAKSEDEKIRKALINGFNKFDKSAVWYNGITNGQILAWLEKQGEPIEINPTEFDTRLQALISKFDSLPKEELIGSLSFWMNVVQNDGAYKADEKQGKQKPTDDDMKEALHTEYEKGRVDAIMEMQKSWSEEDRDYYDAIITKLEVTQDDAALTDNQMEFLKSLKDRIHLNQEWSEEDMSKVQRICKYLDEAKKYYADITEVRECMNWLKSLRPQNHWRPSDEQIKALHDLNLTGNISYAGQGQVLIELYNDLKKLREE